MHASVCNVAERRSPSRACLPEVSEGCAASHLKSVDQAGACGEYANVLVSRVFKHVLAVECTSFFHLKNLENALVVNGQAFLSRDVADWRLWDTA